MREIDKTKPIYLSLGASEVQSVQIVDEHTKSFGDKHDVLFDNKKTFLKDERATYRFVGTEEVKDRDGDIVKIDGVDVSTFKTNPVVLWAHDSRDMPVGRVVSVVRDETGTKLYFDIQFADTMKAKDIENLVKTGFLKAVSIGFMVKEYDWDVETEALLFTAIDIFEISVCSVPANQNALLVEEDKSKKSKSKDLTIEDITQVIRQEVQAALDERANEEVTTPETAEEPETPDVPEEVKDEVSEDSASPTLESLQAQLDEVLGLITPQPEEDSVEEVVQQTENISDETETATQTEPEQPQDEVVETVSEEVETIEHIEIDWLTENTSEDQ